MRECLNSFTGHLLTFVCALALPSPQTYIDKFPPGGLVIRPNDSGHPFNSVWPFGHWGWRVWFCCETILKCSLMLGKEVASRNGSSRSSIVLCGLTKKNELEETKLDSQDHYEEFYRPKEKTKDPLQSRWICDLWNIIPANKARPWQKSTLQRSLLHHKARDLPHEWASACFRTDRLFNVFQKKVWYIGSLGSLHPPQTFIQPL